jgi:hypothetical protein
MDAEILKTLQNIEKLLKNTTSLSANKTLPPARGNDRSEQKENRSIQREFKASAASLKGFKDSIYGLITGVSGLKSEVSKATSAFGAFGSQFAKFMSSLESVEVKSAQPVTLNLTSLDKAVLKLIDTNLSIEKTLATSTSLLQKMSDCVCERVDARPEQNQDESTWSAISNKVLGKFFSKETQKPAENTVKATKAVKEENEKLAKSTNGFNTNLTFTGSMLHGLGQQFDKLKQVIVTVTSDFFKIAGVGMGSTESLMTLYKNALLAGMSLEEYMSILKDNTAVTRSSSLADFNKTISSADKQLAELGVFGNEARALQASLADSNTRMGVSQNKLTSAAADQISMFEKLRKATNMSAAEFGTLVRSVAENDQAQRELVGLHPAERQARQQQLLSVMSLGKQMGLTTAQSEKLGAAMMAARGEGASTRYESAGRLRQMGAIVGMGGEAQRLAQLTLKGASRSTQEEAEYQSVLASLDKRIQSERLMAQQTGNLGYEYQLDELEKTIKGSGAGQIMDASRAATLAQESGRAGANADFGKSVGVFEQAVAQFATIINGFFKSPLAGLSAAIGGAVAFAFKGPLMRMLGGAFTGGPGGGAVSGAAKVAADAATQAKNLFYSFGYQAGRVTALISNSASKTFSFLKGGALSAFDTIRKTYNALSLSSAITSPLEVVKNLFAGAGNSIFNFVSKPFTAIKNLMSSMQFGNIASLIKTPIETIKGLFGSIPSKLSSIIPSLKGMATSISGFAQAIPGMSAIGNAFSGLLPAIKKLPLIGGLITAGMEIFTGEMTAALNPSGGIMNTIFGVATAFLTAIPNLIIDSMAFVFGDDLIQPLRNIFDGVVAGINQTFKELLGGIAGGIAGLLKYILPKDSKLIKFLEGAQSALNESAAETAATTKKLVSDKNATLSKISEENKAKAAEANKEGKKAVDQATATAKQFNNVMYGLPAASTIVSDAKTLVGTQQQAAKPIQATPEVQKPTQVAPEQINKQSSEQGTTNSTTSNTETTSLASPDVVGILQSMLAVLQQNLMTDQEQLKLTGQLIGQSRVKADFSSSAMMADRILGPRSV